MNFNVTMWSLGMEDDAKAGIGQAAEDAKGLCLLYSHTTDFSL